MERSDLNLSARFIESSKEKPKDTFVLRKKAKPLFRFEQTEILCYPEKL